MTLICTYLISTLNLHKILNTLVNFTLIFLRDRGLKRIQKKEEWLEDMHAGMSLKEKCKCVLSHSIY